MKIALFGSRHQKEHQIKKIFDILSANCVDVYVQERFYSYLSSNFDLEYKIKGIISSDDFNTDIAISVGGDGTFLRTASSIGKKDIPIVGINAGRLGFLADITDTELESALSEIILGNYKIEHRDQLELSTEDKVYHGFNYALNEIAVLKQDSASMITVHSHINGEYLNSYQADGLIIATSTGSTAYSMSVGGPIMTPTTPCFIISPVAPHSLNNRPLVISSDSEISLDIESRNGSFLISLDGRSNVFQAGTRLIIKKADFSLKVIKRTQHTFFSTLRDKLMWGADPRLS